MEELFAVIDVRSLNEVKMTPLQTTNENCLLYNIPTNNIPNNVNNIEEMSKKKMVYIICASGMRANMVKTNYFSKNDNVISIGGISNADLKKYYLKL